MSNEIELNLDQKTELFQSLSDETKNFIDNWRKRRENYSDVQSMKRCHDITNFFFSEGKSEDIGKILQIVGKGNSFSVNDLFDILDEIEKELEGSK